MKNPLNQELRRLVKHELDPAKHQMNKEEAAQWLQALPELLQAGRHSVDILPSWLAGGRLYKKHLRQMHRECIRLLDALPRLGSGEAFLQELLAAVQQVLQQLLEYIEEDRNALDWEVDLPQFRLQVYKQELAPQLLALELRIKSLDVAGKLQQAILSAFNDFQRLKRCSHLRYDYLLVLFEKVEATLQRYSKADVHYYLKETLLSLNFNSPAFISWYEEDIRKGLEGLFDVEERRAALEQLEMEFRLVRFRNYGGYFDPDRVKAVKQMHAFVLKLFAGQAPRHPAPDAGSVPHLGFAGQARNDVGQARNDVGQARNDVGQAPVYRIRTAFSVDALAYFFRLLVQSKVIESGVKTELYVFLAKTFTTPGTGSNGFSAGSLSSGYNNVVQTTAMQVRAALLRMVGLIDSEFGLTK